MGFQGESRSFQTPCQAEYSLPRRPKKRFWLDLSLLGASKRSQNQRTRSCKTSQKLISAMHQAAASTVAELRSFWILDSRARFARAQFSYLDVEARRPCWGVVRSRSGTPTPFAGYTFLYTSASGNKEHTEHLPQCLDASIPCLLKHNPS